ncbi:MAG: S9 family peptidase [candidate division Zixibacteria bacterium]|nr:S9 family peptidase [candidate division Zixibacteria bacterium]
MKRAAASHRRAITADDLFTLKIVTSVSLSSDERKIGYTVEQIDYENNKYYTNIYMRDIVGGKTTQFTHGQHGDGRPIWSPDGAQIAFVSTREKKSGIYVMPSAGGAEKKIFEAEALIGEPTWHPDGKHLVMALRYRDSHFIKDEKKKQEPPVYRHITRLLYRLDGLGFLPQDPWQIYVLDIETGLTRKLTSGKRDNYSPALSPDGKLVAYVSNRAKDPDLDSLRDDLFVIPFSGGKEKLIPTPAGPIAGPVFSPNGRTIAYIGHANPDDAWGVTNFHVWTVGVIGAPKARDLTPKFDRMAVDQSITDLEDVHDKAMLNWSADGKRLFFLSSDTGTTNLYYVPASGGKPTRIFKGKCHIKGFSVNGKTQTAAIVHADLNNPGEIMTCPTQYGGEKRAKTLTDLNPQLRTTIKLGRTRDLMFQSFDGTEVQGFLLTPPFFKPGRKYPAILEIHGGPRTQYAFSFFHEMQLLAAQGYVVFYTNPRGGSGRGETWADAIAGGWGDLDYKDCMAAADYMESLKFVDAKRIGVTGGSYGGWMTNWIIGHTHRFKAAVTQRSVTDLISFTGSSDIGYAGSREFDGFPWTNKANYEKCSPIYYMEKVKTPVLIIHNERDLRCHIEQAEQMFVKLKVLGKTVEFVRFPDEPHGLSRHGRPDRRKARLEWILKWFSRYLK